MAHLGERYTVASLTGYRSAAINSTTRELTDWMVHDSLNCYRTVGYFPAPLNLGGLSEPECEAAARELAARLNREHAACV